MNKAPWFRQNYSEVRAGIVELLEAARTASVRSVNLLMPATYWEIGRRIVESEQAGQGRAGYGAALIRQLASDLTTRICLYGDGMLLHLYRRVILWMGRTLRCPSKSPMARSDQGVYGGLNARSRNDPTNAF